MKNVSSILTLVIKIFLPTLWLVFFGAMTLAVWFSDDATVGLVGIPTFKIGLTIFFFCCATLFYFTLLQVKRVEMDGDFVFVTNYFKHARYPYHNIARIVKTDWLLFTTVRIELKIAGIFGKKIIFVPSNRRLAAFLSAHPSLSDYFEKK